MSSGPFFPVLTGTTLVWLSLVSYWISQGRLALLAIVIAVTLGCYLTLFWIPCVLVRAWRIDKHAKRWMWGFPAAVLTAAALLYVPAPLMLRIKLNESELLRVCDEVRSASGELVHAPECTGVDLEYGVESGGTVFLCSYSGAFLNDVGIAYAPNGPPPRKCGDHPVIAHHLFGSWWSFALSL